MFSIHRMLCLALKKVQKLLLLRFSPLGKKTHPSGVHYFLTQSQGNPLSFRWKRTLNLYWNLYWTFTNTLLTKLLGLFIELSSVLFSFFLSSFLECYGLTSMTKWLKCWIPNPGVQCSKPLVVVKVHSVFHPSEVDKTSTRNFWELT